MKWLMVIHSSKKDDLVSLCPDFDIRSPLNCTTKISHQEMIFIDLKAQQNMSGNLIQLFTNWYRMQAEL